MNRLLADVKDVDARGSWTAVANASSVIDRDGERLMPNALHWRTPTVPVHADHRLSVAALVGRARPYYERGTLMVDGTFGTSELAQSTRQAVLDGTLDSMSIVFIDPTRRKGRDGVTEITGGELVACDFVSVASNPDARVVSARAYRPSMRAEVDRVIADALITLAELDLDEIRRAEKAAPTPPMTPAAARAFAARLLADLPPERGAARRAVDRFLEEMNQ